MHPDFSFLKLFKLCIVHMSEDNKGKSMMYKVCQVDYVHLEADL